MQCPHSNSRHLQFARISGDNRVSQYQTESWHASLLLNELDDREGPVSLK
jgi:hypothetical protein